MNTLNGIKWIAWIVYLASLVPRIFAVIGFFKQELVITQKRILGKKGLFSIDVLDIPIDKVDNISYSAGFFGNIFHYYDMMLTTTSGGWAMYGQVENAREFQNAVLEALEKCKDEARKAQAEEIAKSMLRKTQE